MKDKLQKLMTLVFLSFIMSSCSSLIQKYYNQIDASNPAPLAAPASNKKTYDRFSMYRKYKNSDEYNDVRSTKNSKFLLPDVKRRYQKRIKAVDLTDQSNPGSLWYDRGQDNFFFSQNDAKRTGDIILIHVLKKLKDQITQELANLGHEKTSNSESSDEQKADPNDRKLEAEKIYDQISSVVLETINRDHLIIRGIKDVLYKRKHHRIEVKALVKRTNVNDNDVIKSDDFLESNIRILR